MTEATTRVGYSVPLGSREFRAIFVAQLVSIAGTSIAAVALTVLVYRKTSSPLLASLVFAIGFLPYVIGGGILSSVVDRVRPRRLVTSCDALSAVLAATMALPAVPVGALLPLLLGIGTLSSLTGGARASLTRSAVSDEAYLPARSLMRIAAQLSQIAGNAGGGALLVVLSPRGALLVDALTFVFSAATVRLGVSDRANLAERADTPLLRDSLRGARTVFAHAEVRRLVVFGWLGPMFAVAPEALAAPYVAAHNGSASLVGWWLVALPVGLVAGDVLAVRLVSQQRQQRLVVAGAIASFLPYLAFVADPPFAIALPVLAVAGLFGAYSLGLELRLRDATPLPLYARTMTLSSAGLMTLQGIGFALAGALAEGISPAATIVAAGACGLAATAWFWRADARRPH